MGKIRVKKLGDAEIEKQQRQEDRKRQEAKRVDALKEEAAVRAEEKKTASETKQSPEKNTVIPTSSPVIPATASLRSLAQRGKAGIQKDEPWIPDQVRSDNVQVQNDKKSVKKSKFAKKQTRSENYQTFAKIVDAKKIYSVQDAVELLPKLKRAKFDETVELNINTIETGVALSTVLPHGTGKQVRVAIADDAIIAEIEKNNINFDVLVAEPSMMPRLAKVARILGPRGLMPNPKNGTVTQKPEEVAKKFQGGQVNYKTEAKFPIMHMSIGKVSFGEKKLEENLKAIVEALPEGKVKSANLKLTMSPAIKIDFTSI